MAEATPRQQSFAYDTARLVLGTVSFFGIAKLHYAKGRVSYVVGILATGVFGSLGRSLQNQNHSRLGQISWTILGGALLGLAASVFSQAAKRFFNGSQEWKMWEAIAGVRQMAFGAGVLGWAGWNCFLPDEIEALSAEIASFEETCSRRHPTEEQIVRYQELRTRVSRYRQLSAGERDPLLHLAEIGGCVIKRVIEEEEEFIVDTTLEQLRAVHRIYYPCTPEFEAAASRLEAIGLPEETGESAIVGVQKLMWYTACAINTAALAVVLSWYPKLACVSVIGGLIGYSFCRNFRLESNERVVFSMDNRSVVTHGARTFALEDAFSKARWIAFVAAMLPIQYFASWCAVPLAGFALGVDLRISEGTFVTRSEDTTEA